MGILFYGGTLFFITFFIHLVLWRIHLPRNHTKALIILFLGTLIIALFILINFNKINIFGILVPGTPTEYLRFCFMFISLALFYIVTYGAIEVDSPSLLIVMDIAEAGNSGLDKNTLKEKLKDDILVINRIKDLLVGGFISLDNQLYRLTFRGRLITRLFIIYRKILGAPKGG